jgi:deoxyribonuclease V
MPKQMHTWDITPTRAILLQNELAGQIIRKCRFGAITRIAGIDVSVRNEIGRAAVVVFDYPSLNILEFAIAERRVIFPYIPGLLSFREGPVILDAIDKLSIDPQMFFFDGQGIAHPRRLGIASHIGLLLGVPSIGCAKSRLCGHYNEPGVKGGSFVPLVDRNEIVGAVVRTRSKVKPIFVSIGHYIDLPNSIQYVLDCCRGFRLPETTRRAHQVAGSAFK